MSRTDAGPDSGNPWGLRMVMVVILLIAAAPIGVFAVPQVVGGDQSLAVLSGSMRPAVSPGDAVVVKQVPPETIEAGDIITYRTGRGTAGEPQYVTHRVVRVIDREEGLAFRTIGDANASPDPRPVPAEDVLGRVRLVLPLVGYVVVFAGSTLGRIVLVGTPVALLVLNEVWRALGDPSESPAATPPSTMTDPPPEETMVGSASAPGQRRGDRRIGEIGGASKRNRGRSDAHRHREEEIHARVLDAGDGHTLLRVVDADPGAERELQDGAHLSVQIREHSDAKRR